MRESEGIPLSCKNSISDYCIHFWVGCCILSHPHDVYVGDETVKMLSFNLIVPRTEIRAFIVQEITQHDYKWPVTIAIYLFFI